MHPPEDTDPRFPASASPPYRPGEPDDAAAASGDATQPDPVYVFTRSSARELDRLCTAEFGIPSILLMENAAIGICDACLDLLEDVADPFVLIFCGHGNNGGDGFAVARHLSNHSVLVAIVTAGGNQTLPGDAGTNLDVARKMGIPMFIAEPNRPDAAAERAIEQFGKPVMVIDALLGTGLDRPVKGVLASLIEQVNAIGEGGTTILAADIPSGLDADTGAPVSGGPAVKADVTVTLAGPKTGFLAVEAQPFLGEIVVASIGAPIELIQRLGRPLPDNPRPDEPNDRGVRIELRPPRMRPGPDPPATERPVD